MSSDLELPESFDYTTLDAETRELVLRTTGETQNLLRRTAENILAIGQNLLLVQQHLPDMTFSAWLRAEFALSRQSAYNYIKVATRFSGSCQTVLQLPARVLYQLASSSDAIIAQVEAGQLAPTRASIRAARDAEERAQAAESQVLLQAEARHTAVDALGAELEDVRRQLAEMAVPPIEVREVEKLVVPAELTAELEDLQHTAQALAASRNALAQQVADLEAQLAAATSERLEGEEERRIRLSWYRVTSEFGRSLRALLSQWPSPLDAQVFTAEDWTRLAHTRELGRRLLAECTSLAEGARIVDARSSQVDGTSEEAASVLE